jgi:hypothetical protein
MPDKKRKKRKAPISYRPPAELREEFEARVQKSGLSTSAFITKSVFTQDAPRQSRRPAIEEKLLARLLAEAAAIRTALHDVSIASTESTNTVLIEHAMGDLSEIRAALLKAMGKQP